MLALPVGPSGIRLTGYIDGLRVSSLEPDRAGEPSPESRESMMNCAAMTVSLPLTNEFGPDVAALDHTQGPHLDDVNDDGIVSPPDLMMLGSIPSDTHRGLGGLLSALSEGEPPQSRLLRRSRSRDTRATPLNRSRSWLTSPSREVHLEGGA